MDNQTVESKPKVHEETLVLGGTTISVRYAVKDDPHIADVLKRSIFFNGFYDKCHKT